jgi:hypothetical protein
MQPRIIRLETMRYLLDQIISRTSESLSIESAEKERRWTNDVIEPVRQRLELGLSLLPEKEELLPRSRDSVDVCPGLDFLDNEFYADALFLRVTENGMSC